MNTTLELESILRKFTNDMELVEENQSEEILFNSIAKSYYQSGDYIFKDFSGNVLTIQTHETLDNLSTYYVPKIVKFNGYTIEPENYPCIMEKAIDLIVQGV